MAVRFHNDDCNYRFPSKRLTVSWLRDVARAEGRVVGEMNYVFCSSALLLEMNRRFLGHDYYTDVITFAYTEAETETVSGDVFIDVETVADNARRYGVTTLDEMRRVVVHGLLHLCGQGDKTLSEANEMRRKEDLYLQMWSDVKY
jgi:rRNA maturation RNase YbeY